LPSLALEHDVHTPVTEPDARVRDLLHAQAKSLTTVFATAIELVATCLPDESTGPTLTDAVATG
jgi:hypothetical protein